tara:strand:+ start:299 stop:625 length:327 start_codon:yes stop_codon:yes gene_type:complete
MENLTINLINKCYYCNILKELLKKFKIDYNMVIVSEKNKNKYKDKNISTFPQVYYHYKKEKILLGGYTEFLKIINHIIGNLKPKDLSLKTSKKNKIRIYIFLVKQLGI